mmetsp:Transcript_43654/g.68357  ORF Transcript_43654/g.68357 Transcript_43654/m.68357 type:complete len:86 (-) Transcript_43654:106-363(-)
MKAPPNTVESAIAAAMLFEGGAPGEMEHRRSPSEELATECKTPIDAKIPNLLHFFCKPTSGYNVLLNAREHTISNGASAETVASR